MIYNLQYMEGQKAFLKGYCREQNPYCKTTSQYDAWDSGWSDECNWYFGMML